MSDAFAYHLFRAAMEKYGRNPGALDADERAAARTLADRTCFLEARVLAAAEARGVVVAEAAVAAVRDEVAARYDDPDAFRGDLAAAGLDEADLRAALERQLRVDAVLETIAEDVPGPAEADIAAFYQRNLAKFRTPERRKARHILITVNPDFPENAPEAARRRIEAIRARLLTAPAAGAGDAFAREAAAHSECPTALQGGELGYVHRGQLAPGLDAAVFGLAPGALSGVVETEFGLHVARCDDLVPERVASLDEARPQIAQALGAALRAQAQRQWLLRIGARHDGPPATATHRVQERGRSWAH